ncbi:MAG TPA: hypothetical protein VGE41_10565 [Verrucomicrobiae bacterium]|jgi:ElaB/YqjD/DUF883 family membrane-anchored ribosome-binding protein
MEVYFKNLSAEEVTTERLVEDIFSLVEETEKLLRITGVALAQASREEIRTRLEKVKICGEKLRQQAAAGVRATDKVIRQHPYSFVSLVFAVGVACGFWAGRRD